MNNVTSIIIEITQKKIENYTRNCVTCHLNILTFLEIMNTTARMCLIRGMIYTIPIQRIPFHRMDYCGVNFTGE